jgi:hypothetical protein
LIDRWHLFAFLLAAAGRPFRRGRAANTCPWFRT